MDDHLWAKEALQAMLGRVRLMVEAEYERLLAELRR
jgi:hypothetical protein